MSAQLLSGGNPATDCIISPTTAHRPTPLRFVWHHVQPEAAGGLITIPVCDSCHYTIHRLLYALKLKYLGKPITAQQQSWLDNPPRQAQLMYAQKGLDLCIAAGTVDKIPNEGLQKWLLVLTIQARSRVRPH